MGEAGYEFKDENIEVDKDRLRVLWEESRLDTLTISDVMVVWSKKILMRDEGGWGWEWEYLALESGLLELFSIHVFVRMPCGNSMACPLARFEGEGDIEWEVDGLDGDGKVSNWQF